MANKLDYIVNHYRFDASVPSRIFTLMVLQSLDLDHDWAEQFHPDRDFLRRMTSQMPLFDNDHGRSVSAVAAATQTLHKFGLKEGGNDFELECASCGVSITVCGATEDSWYCPYNPPEDDGT